MHLEMPLPVADSPAVARAPFKDAVEQACALDPGANVESDGLLPRVPSAKVAEASSRTKPPVLSIRKSGRSRAGAASVESTAIGTPLVTNLTFTLPDRVCSRDIADCHKNSRFR